MDAIKIVIFYFPMNNNRKLLRNKYNELVYITNIGPMGGNVSVATAIICLIMLCKGYSKD